MLVRIAAFGTAAFALWFAVQSLRAPAPEPALENVSDHVLLGASYRPGQVTSLLGQIEAARIESACHPNLADAAVVRLRARTLALEEGRTEEAARQLTRAIENLEGDLSCRPAKAFSWLLLFIARSARDRDPAPHFQLLGLCFQLAPNEGSFNATRLRAALPHVRSFGPGMIAYVRNDIMQIMRDRPDEMVRIYAEADPSTKTFLANYFAEAEPEARRTMLLRLEAAEIDPPAGLLP